jgi:hypothetical protein
MITAPGTRVEIGVEGTTVGTAARMAIDEATGVVRLEEMDSLATVFFSERIGAGGPDGALLRDLDLREPAGGAPLLTATTATVRQFSSGTAEITLEVTAEALRDATDARRT